MVTDLLMNEALADEVVRPNIGKVILISIIFFQFSIIFLISCNSHGRSDVPPNDHLRTTIPLNTAIMTIACEFDHYAWIWPKHRPCEDQSDRSQGIRPNLEISDVDALPAVITTIIILKGWRWRMALVEQLNMISSFIIITVCASIGIGPL